MFLAAAAPVFIIVLAGFLIRRSGMLSREADGSLLRTYINVLYPCLIVSTIIGNSALQKGANVWIPPVVGFLLVSLSYALCYGAARLLRIPPGAPTRTFTYITALYNYSFMAVPMVAKLFGTEALGVLFTHNLGVEIGLWVGASLIMAPLSESESRSTWRRVLSAPVIAIMAALVLNAVHAERHLPGWVLNTAQTAGAAAIPIALLLTGATLDDFLGELRPTGSGLAALIGGCVLRLGLLPLVFIAAACFLPLSLELKQVLVVQAAMPCAMLPIVLTKLYKGDTPMAAQIIFGTTILAILTIPYWMHLGIKLAGLTQSLIGASASFP